MKCAFQDHYSIQMVCFTENFNDNLFKKTHKKKKNNTQ